MKNKKDYSLYSLIIGSVGVVYGDIGTSPLYALKSCFSIGDLPVTPENIMGLISIFIWSLLLIVTLKYIHMVMRIDDHGEGGVLILSKICERLLPQKKAIIPIIMGIIGGALLFGDGVITPAISVLGALEGLQLISPLFSPYILLLSCIILTGIFYIQKSGSGIIGSYFGPIMIIWFFTIGILGAQSIYHTPSILMAFNPYYAVHFLMHNNWVGFLALGGTILVVTGSEAIYADMGHFGRKPITISWTFFVLPALILNYLGQGAILLESGENISNPFYNLAPSYLLYPLIGLSTMATIIASQAILSGVFSLTWQAIMLNYLPRIKVIHTSSSQYGQVFVPAVNRILFFLTLTAVITFRSSENLAVAYGLSVAGCMWITTCLVSYYAYQQWKWPKWQLFAWFTPLILLDTIFVMTNLIKIVEGAWYTVLVTSFISYLVFVWIKGSEVLEEQKVAPSIGLKSYLTLHEKENQTRIPGTAVFMTRFPDKVPNSLMIHLHHNKYLHRKLIFISILVLSKPKTNGEDKFSSTKLNRHTYVIKANFGFMEVPSLRKIMNWAKEHGIVGEHEDISFFLSKGIPVPSPRSALSGFGENLYIYLSKNSLSAYEFYNIPYHKVIELGVRYKI
ncbi:MAG: KUP/HAK/KT family potassium transporter [Alphaproteobacteria bacterium]|nr:KUP/HAK/KT family potassium transporter [Alphaproteobacteria bacterium]